MGALIGSSVEVNITVGNETVTMVCRRPSAAEMSNFLKNRFEAKGRKVKTHLYEARTALMDKILVDVKNADYQTAAGESKPLNSQTALTDADKTYWSGLLGVRVEGWRDLIPVSWKSSAAMWFEDPQPNDDADDGDTEKN